MDRRKVFLALVLALALLGGAAAARAGSVPFVELVYEIDISPFDHRAVPKATIGSVPQGYVLREFGDGFPAVLYPANGRRGKGDASPPLWIAERFINLIPGYGVESKRLTGAAVFPFTANADANELIADPIRVEVTLAEQGVVHIKTSSGDVVISHGETQTLATFETTRTLDQLAAALAGSFGRDEDETLARRAAIREQLRALSATSEQVQFFARLTAIHRGTVRTGTFDVLYEWREANRLIREGPYGLALEAVERLLEAMPLHAGANDMFDRIIVLVDSNAIPAQIVGTVDYADAEPTAEIEAYWRDIDPGFALLARPEDPSGSGFAVAPIEDGAFEFHVPAGDYRLTVALPGYPVLEVDVSAGTDTRITVPIRDALE